MLLCGEMCYSPDEKLVLHFMFGRWLISAEVQVAG